MKKIIGVIVIMSSMFLSHAESVFILVHGTWGADCTWYVAQGDFFDSLEQVVSKKDSTVVSFRWSGGCSHEARVKAAQSLVKLIQTYDTSVAIYIVAHSHGGNIAAIASHMLSQDETNQHHVRALFTLGTPIMSTYLPNMSTIHYIYNLFSFEDLIQTVFGISVREYPKHKRVANLRVFINQKEPDHTGLHHPIVGKWLAHLHSYFKNYLQRQGITDRISEPSIVYFTHDKAPEYAFDIHRADLLERDRQLSRLILDSFRDLDTRSNMSLT